MGWSSEQKKNTRVKILHSAAELFTRDGFEQVGIDDVMHHAGMTRGAFYNHFSSKSELYAEAILTAAQDAQSRARQSADINFSHLIEQYLSLTHRKGEIFRCPLAFLTTDINQRDKHVRSAYTKVLKGFVQNINQLDESSPSTEHAMQKAVLMIGAIAISRAINDEQYADKLLSSCRDAVLS